MLQIAINYYNDIMNTSDPRVGKLFLMDTPAYVFIACVGYLILVYGLVPKYMQNKQPYKLKQIITLYNIVQVITSAYIFYECLAVGWFTKYDIFRCHPVDFSENDNSVRELRITYIYFLSKFTEFLETLFFILRKKFQQITFLHVYHHVSMPLYSWSITKFYPGGSALIVAMLNSGVHVVMYMYYLLSGLGPHMQKYLWWKKYLTGLQLVQFITGTIHLCLVFVSDHRCNISKLFAGFYIGLGCIFYGLFSQFYTKAYKQNKIISGREEFRKSGGLKTTQTIYFNNNNNVKNK